ncbi:LuxR family transcriptional regulator [Streptomyces sp. Je 1-369]|uniref:LuxR family transcriptional regulator n=1 Tax=Streptomyces sp. Je 1-369 TaxID=2966192 RepID=UPI0022860964|nr:LuxR family transcriptional regulator [Streptomyces sp. Je 1-369]WAL93203.1 LuxR family transcriptional regulator [Streptomyces sp. Je 1-369]
MSEGSTAGAGAELGAGAWAGAGAGVPELHDRDVPWATRHGVPELTGRDTQRAVIDAALGGIATTGTSVILRGDPGTGRTALLGTAEATARRAGLRVLRMTGAEAESGLPFAALHQVLWPLLDDAEGLAEPQRHALESALGVREGAPPEGFAVAGAALTLLAHAAAHRPVVVLLDDLQWADPSSVAVFGYVQRHLAPLPVVAIAATRRNGAAIGRIGSGTGFTGPVTGFTGSRTGRTGSESRRTGSERGRTGSGTGRTKSETGRTGSGTGRTGTGTGLGSAIGFTGSETGPTESETGPTGTDSRPTRATPRRDRTAAREEYDASACLVAGQVVDLPPLDAPQAELLLRTHHPSLPEGLRRRVLRAAAGNPLALRELPEQVRRLDADRAESLASPAPPRMPELFDALPLGGRLGRLYEDRLRSLPDPARNLLLVAALGDASTRHRTVLRDLAEHVAGPPWHRLEEHIERSGLAHVDPEQEQLEFHHPLVRASLAHTASPAELRAAHRLLADALPANSSRRTLHLAAAALGTDGELAALLHAEADSMSAQGGDAEATVLMARAAGLSPDRTNRTARLVAAAALAVRAGRPHLAAQYVAEAEDAARPGRPEPATPYAFAVACTRLQLDADPRPTIELLPAVLDAPVPPDAADQHAALLGPILFLLLVAAALTGDERAWDAVDRHAAHPSAPAAAELCRQAWSGPRPAAHEVPRRLRETVAALPADRETTEAWLLLWTAAAVDSLGEHCTLWNAFARRHAYATQTFTDSLRAHDDYLHGNWDTALAAALAAARDGARTSAEHGYALAETLFLQTAGHILAARGDLAGLDALEPVLGVRAAEHRLRLVTGLLSGMRTLCALGHGHAEEAWLHACDLTAPDAVEDRSPWTHLSLVDRVQAAVDSGRTEEARRHLRAVRTYGLARISAHHTFLVSVAEAIAAVDDEADERYAAVYAQRDAESWPFPLARAHLAHGVWLHRQHRTEEASAHCRAALTAFARLDATPWTARASRELAAVEAVDAVDADTGASGGTAGHHPLLSAQETRIARFAAQGLTNRQIGARLSLSPRTIGAHLYRIFPKLGITTRAGIARALGTSLRNPAAPAQEPPAT